MNAMQSRQFLLISDLHVLAAGGAGAARGLLRGLRGVAADAVAADVLRILRGLPHRLHLPRHFLHLHLVGPRHFFLLFRGPLAHFVKTEKYVQRCAAEAFNIHQKFIQTLASYSGLVTHMYLP